MIVARRSRSRFNDDVLILDIGRVIIDGLLEDLTRDEPSFLSVVRPVPLAYRCVKHEVERRFGRRVWLLSKCRRLYAHNLIRAWLEKKGFFDQTGVPRDHVWFCDTNAEKAPIIRRLGGTVVVDDSLEVHLHIPFVHRRILFRPDPEEVVRACRMFGIDKVPDGISVVPQGWRNVSATIAEFLGSRYFHRTHRR